MKIANLLFSIVFFLLGIYEIIFGEKTDAAIYIGIGNINYSLYLKLSKEDEQDD